MIPHVSYLQGEGVKMKVRRTPIHLGGAPADSPPLPTQATLYKTGFHGCILSMKVWNNKVFILPWLDIYCFQNLKWIFQFLIQIVDDDSGLGGFGAEIDFTNNKIVRDRVNIKCVDQCL